MRSYLTDKSLSGTQKISPPSGYVSDNGTGRYIITHIFPEHLRYPNVGTSAMITVGFISGVPVGPY